MARLTEFHRQQPGSSNAGGATGAWISFLGSRSHYGIVETVLQTPSGKLLSRTYRVADHSNQTMQSKCTL
jgi:hypothetical protein